MQPDEHALIYSKTKVSFQSVAAPIGKLVGDLCKGWGSGCRKKRILYLQFHTNNKYLNEEISLHVNVYYFREYVWNLFKQLVDPNY